MGTRIFSLLASAALVISSSIMASAAEKLSWDSKQLLAGKANLGDESGFVVQRNLGTVNFAPEMRVPIQLIYRSIDEGKLGLFGSNWSCPQLESRVFPREGGEVEWITPWGEHIGFYEKPKNNDAPELFKEKSKGQVSLFTPYADWEAKIVNGNGSVVGRFKNEGWRFEYSGSRLSSITSPNDRKVSFSYNGDRLSSVSSGSVEFINLEWGKDAVSKITVNGISCAFDYTKTEVPVLPDALGMKSTVAKRVFLNSVSIGSLASETFAYNADGFLSSTQRGSNVETFTVEHVTETEQLAFLQKIADAKAAHKPIVNILPEKVAGRILADNDFKYLYPQKDMVTLQDKTGRAAMFSYSSLKGVLKTVDFAGQKSEVYYFRRYDVAYNGKLRQIRDSKDRVAVSCRYDKTTGEIVMMRDMADNEIRYDYDKCRNLTKVSRTGDISPSDPLVPMVAYKYDERNNPVSVMTLGDDGKPVFATDIIYDGNSNVTSVRTPESEFKLTYNGFGMPVRVADIFNNVSRIEYDRFNRPVSSVGANGVCSVSVYDSNGLVSEVKTFTSDKKEELMSSASLSYDAEGRLVSVTDNKGRVKTVERDEKGLVSAETHFDGSKVKYEHDVLGNLSKVVDQNGNPIDFAYNNLNKLAERVTPAGQVESYSYDSNGLVKSIKNAFASDKEPAREIRMAYDDFDHVSDIYFGDAQSKSFKRDSWGKIVGIEARDEGKGSRSEELAYDKFGRVIKKTETDEKGKATSFEYSYMPSGKTAQTKVTFADGKVRTTTNSYDRYGRLSMTDDGIKRVQYSYSNDNKLIKQSVDGIVDINFEYDKLGRLSAKYMGDPKSPLASLKYTYDKDGTLSGRSVNGKVESFQYDARGQLTGVKDSSGNYSEKYAYDPAGNILEKTIDGKTTKFTYDAANQLVMSVDASGKKTRFEYDGAGRMSKEFNDLNAKNFSYGWLDKVMEVSSTSGEKVDFGYSIDGQVANRTELDQTESFTWDGLSLIRRDDVSYMTEAHPNGGNALVAEKDGKASVLFNDMLGSSMGSIENGDFKAISRTSFGEAKGSSDVDFFTGKPNVEGLGYSFLLRNYRADLGKWGTSDPLGYPDGFNNFAYCNNSVMEAFDFLGAATTYTLDGNSLTSDTTPAKGKNGTMYFVDNLFKMSITGNTVVNLFISSIGNFYSQSSLGNSPIGMFNDQSSLVLSDSSASKTLTMRDNGIFTYTVTVSVGSTNWDSKPKNGYYHGTKTVTVTISSVTMLSTKTYPSLGSFTPSTQTFTINTKKPE